MDGLAIGADVGGTFTDIVAVSDGGVQVRKVLSAKTDYAAGVLKGIEACINRANGAAALPGLARVVHATTVATNAVLEARGARTGLVTTAGFRDVLEIGRTRRPTIYDLGWSKPAPLVRRAQRLEVQERIDSSGSVLLALDVAGARRVIDELLAMDVEAIAVCLLNSHVNPTHELELGRLIRSRSPDTYVSLSSQILPRIREYERTSTAVVNAYVGPIMTKYLSSLRHGVKQLEPTASLLLMQSNAGLVPMDVATERPAALVESGPAAGALAAATLARRLRMEHVLALDIGGTTAKASLIENGALAETAELEVGAGINIESRLVRGGGYVVSLPAVDLAEVGAGGGSIARVDAGGALIVGPQSAGSAPGPVCYGLGGARPTVTDAFAVLGFLGDDGIAGGDKAIDVDSARESVRRDIADRLQLTLEDAAWGIFTVATATMVRAVRAVSTERGRDPRTLPLIAFGGAGPVHAAEMASQIGVRKVVIPVFPGVFTSLGLLLADMRFEFASTVLRRSDQLGDDDLYAVFGALREQGHDRIRALGIDRTAGREQWVAECRYQGQSGELPVEIDPGDGVQRIARRFTALHRQVYGHASGSDIVQLVTVQLRIIIPSTTVDYDALAARTGTKKGRAGGSERRAYFGPKHGWRDTPVIARSDLRATRTGPLIIGEYDTTVVVPPSFEAALDEAHNVILTQDR